MYVFSLCITHSVYLSVFVSVSVQIFLFASPFSVLSLTRSCWPDCCRALTEKKHSEIWHCIIMPNMHLSLTHCASLSGTETLTERPLGFIDPDDNSCQICARCQHLVKTTGTHVVKLQKHRRTAVKGCKSARREGAAGILFVPSVLQS